MLTKFREQAIRGRERGMEVKSSPVFSSNTSWGWSGFSWANSKRSTVNYAAEAGYLSDNGTCMTCIGWMQRTLPESPIQVYERIEGETKPVPVADHKLVNLVQRPNRKYTGQRLLQMTILSFMENGNAYWHKSREGRYGPPGELWWLNHRNMRVIADSKNYIDHYEYWLQGKKTEYAPEDIVHIPCGLNPYFEVEGRTPWMALLEEVSSDNQGSIYSESILRNNGALAGVAAPVDKEVILDPSEVALVDAQLAALTQGGKAGGWKTLAGAVQLQKLNFSPEELTLDKLRTFPQDMICAAVGLSSMLLDLPGGALSKTYANKTEAREAAYESNVIPTLEYFGSVISLQLLPDFEKDNPNRWVGFDYSNVRVLQEDQDKLWKRSLMAKQQGVLTVNETRALLGYTEIEGGDELSQPSTGDPMNDRDEEQPQRPQDGKSWFPDRVKATETFDKAAWAQKSRERRRVQVEEPVGNGHG